MSYSRPILLLALLFGGASPAAEIILIGGRTMQGTVIAEDDAFMELAIQHGRQTVTMKMPRGRIHAIRDGDEERIITAEATAAERPTARSRQVNAAPEASPKPEAPPQPSGPTAMAFRNDFTGIYPVRQPPTRFGPGVGVVWSLPLTGGKSNASPVINGSRVFCMAEPDSLIAVDKETGSELWRATNSLGDAGAGGEPHRPSWLSTYGYTCMTPVTRGDWIWTALGNGVVAGYSTAGERQWIHKVDVSGRHHGCAASPCLVGEILVTYTTSGSNGNYYGFEATTGQMRWSLRNKITQGGLVPLSAAGKTYALSSGGVLIDPQSGSVVVEAGTIFGAKGADGFLGHNWGATVVVDGSTAYFSNHTADTNGTLMVAVDFAAPSSPKVLWHTPTGGRIGASHVLHEGLLYLAGGRCIDAANGETVYEGQAGKASYSSLAMAGDLLYQFGKKSVDIWKPGRQFQSVAKMEHGFGDFIASPVFDGKVMYFRDSVGLHCLGGR